MIYVDWLQNKPKKAALMDEETGVKKSGPTAFAVGHDSKLSQIELDI